MVALVHFSSEGAKADETDGSFDPLLLGGPAVEIGEREVLASALASQGLRQVVRLVAARAAL